MTSTFQGTDTGLLAVGLVFIIVRQFVWRRAEADKLLKLPLLLIGAGACLTLYNGYGGKSLTAFTWAAMVLEVGLVLLTGTAMGLLTQFRKRAGRLCYRLAPWGMGLWALLFGVRVGSFFLAERLGVPLLATTGTVMIFLGLNRLASALVVRRRLARRGEKAEPALAAASI